jgi:hypothetical protein
MDENSSIKINNMRRTIQTGGVKNKILKNKNVVIAHSDDAAMEHKSWYHKEPG